MQIITPAQCRAARALLNWSQPELAEKCDVHVQTISNFEKESSTPSKTTLAKVSEILEANNIEFIGSDGVRIKSTGLKSYSGQTGYHEFYEDIYNTIKETGGDIYVSNVDEVVFCDWLGTERTIMHKKRMHEIWKKKKFKFRILIEEGDNRLAISEIAEYKWVQKSRFADIPFYIYGNKLAIILFEPKDVNVYVIANPKIAQAYKRQFQVIWDQGIDIPKELHKNIERFVAHLDE